MSESMYKHFALLGFLTYWTISLLMVRKWWGGRQKTFSLHAATGKASYITFATAVTLEVTFYMLFAFKWFIPHFGMPFIFGVLIVAVAGLHFLAGLVPETKGVSKWIHRKASYISVILFLPAFFIIATTIEIGLVARLVAGSYFVVELVLWCVYIAQPARRKDDLIHQSFFISSLPITLILATYLK